MGLRRRKIASLSNVRINKAIADSGYCARRKADELVTAGRVRVNGHMVDTPGLKIDPETDVVTIDHQPLPRISPVYLALHKPVGYVTTRRAQDRRKTVYELLPPAYQAADPAGRLDADSSGLLIFSSDGDFLHGLTHPRFHWPKVYEIRLDRPLSPAALQRLLDGVPLQPENRLARMADIQPDETHPAQYRMTLMTGYNRQIRRSVEAIGRRVLALHRTAFGPLELGDLPRGAFRTLTDAEKNSLIKAK
jgi:23S rRNA pseudouridine2605 synthase